MTTLEHKSCLPCEGYGKSLTKKAAQQLLIQLAHGWQMSQDDKSIYKDFTFKNYYHTMAFVNAIAWIAHHENHHPDLEVGYNHCRVRYSTHALNGLTENDFICAKKIDGVIQSYEQKK